MKTEELIYDEEKLIRFAQAGDSSAMEKLLNRYKGLTYHISDQYYLRDGDRKDLRQEALLGLVEAIKSYNPDKSVKSFKNFAVMCIQRGMFSCLKRSNRLKRRVLSDAVSLFVDSDQDENKQLVGGRGFMGAAIRDKAPTPEEFVVERESAAELLETVANHLTDMEREILYLRLEGYTYREITIGLNLKKKSVDNAVQRIRRKIHANKILCDLRTTQSNRVVL